MNVSAIRFSVIMTAIFLFLTGCAEQEEKTETVVVRPVRTMVLTSSVSGRVRTFPGKVQASQQVDLAFRISGPLVEFPVKEGQAIKKNDLLARIDPRDYKTDQTQIHESRGKARRCESFGG